MDLPIERAAEPASRWQLLRDVVAFQCKLVLDGLRDILLSPVSLIAAIAGILTHRREPGVYFYRLLSFGHKTDRWINLFDTYKDEDVSGEREPSADTFVKHAENIVLKEYEKGGALNDIKIGADRVIDRLNASHETRTHVEGQGKGKGQTNGKDKGSKSNTDP